MNLPESTYCVKCKRHTLVGKTIGHKQSGHRHYWFHKCPVCGNTKSRLVRESDVKEGGFLFDLLGKLLSPVTSLFGIGK